MKLLYNVIKTCKSSNQRPLICSDSIAISNLLYKSGQNAIKVTSDLKCSLTLVTNYGHLFFSQFLLARGSTFQVTCISPEQFFFSSYLSTSSKLPLPSTHQSTQDTFQDTEGLPQHCCENNTEVNSNCMYHS